MKKFCGVLILTVALVLVSSCNNRAEAQDVYMGTWRSGYDAYLMTETISEEGPDRVPSLHNYWCTIKAVKGSDVMYINYHFWLAVHGRWNFRNSDGVQNFVDSKTPIEKATLLFISPDIGTRL